MTQADKEQDNGKEKEKERDKEKDKEQQRGVKRPIAPPTIPEPIQEVSDEFYALSPWEIHIRFKILIKIFIIFIYFTIYNNNWALTATHIPFACIRWTHLSSVSSVRTVNKIPFEL